MENQSECSPPRTESPDSLPTHRIFSVPELADVVNIADQYSHNSPIACYPYRHPQSGFYQDQPTAAAEFPGRHRRSWHPKWKHLHRNTIDSNASAKTGSPGFACLSRTPDLGYQAMFIHAAPIRHALLLVPPASRRELLFCLGLGFGAPHAIASSLVRAWISPALRLLLAPSEYPHERRHLALQWKRGCSHPSGYCSSFPCCFLILPCVFCFRFYFLAAQ
ncbi:hypothetical protein B0T16DRAFT_199078 [Cercophora newfieldiana]|uniref:Uncharacterized protein n=1 Tax=Cercophora newfieldiana TaxID=92897 RepID=A0AA39Y2M2_9PEZI|nr:hypothetical protein B0T16DRAFT_199078 [Cercophora newfieldiana]